MSAAEQATGEVMDRVYTRQRHIYDLTRRYFLLGRDRLIRELNPPQDGTVLEIGCGTGRNLIAAAHVYPEARFYGIDISTKMLASARASLRRKALEGRIALGRADAADFDPQELFGEAQFDRVFFSYSLSMIPAWREALRCAHHAVAPQGRLLVVDFGQQERLPVWFRRALVEWLARFHVTPRAELEETLQALTRDHGGSASFEMPYRGYAYSAAIQR